MSQSNHWTTHLTQFSDPSLLSLTLQTFDRSFRAYHPDLKLWLRYHWHYSVYICMVYIGVIKVLHNYMRRRHQQPYTLRLPLFLWNLFLALFSLSTCIQCIPELIDIVVNRGFIASYCDSSYEKDIRVVFFYWMFVMSKVWELGDTVFIILRKQPLMPLHWLHHCLTLCYSWFIYADVPSTSRWMVCMNATVHTVMYGYYALKAVRLPVHQSIAKTITTLQIVQMFIGFYINITALVFKLTDLSPQCEVTLPVITTGAAMYTL
ncbi:elongation of very long chain fatty acids protein 6-like [Oppia nitens]|uniref:elongation of very long chain fatty acids protein 6-like n=1 Tax=Oppia nitens TaxID=1686743 RepID=UPI0023DC5DAC|nr:elongation of very long chain fatty acids protein 6-like [Oppia nitens]